MLNWLSTNLTSALRDFPVNIGEQRHTRCDVRGWTSHDGTIKVNASLYSYESNLNHLTARG